MSLLHLSDEELMVKYQTGIYEAFEELYRRHSGLVYGFIKKRVKDEAQVSDIFQEVYMKLHKSKNLYKKDLPFKPWLFTVVKNALIDELRKSKEFVDMDLDQVASGASSPESGLKLSPLLEGLPSSQKTAMEMRYIDEKTFAEIAEALRTSEANVRQIISRATRTLKGLLGKS